MSGFDECACVEDCEFEDWLTEVACWEEGCGVDGDAAWEGFAFCVCDFGFDGECDEVDGEVVVVPEPDGDLCEVVVLVWCESCGDVLLDGDVWSEGEEAEPFAEGV